MRREASGEGRGSHSAKRLPVAVSLAAVGLAAWVLLATAAGESPANVTLRAEGLLLARCSVCHSTDLVIQQRLDRARWEATIQKMIHWGADLNPEEAMLLTGYLASRYHPDLPDQEPVPPAPAEPPPAPAVASPAHPAGVAARGEALYAYNCQACHGAGAAGGVGPKLAGNPILADDHRFRDTVLHGRGAMPAWEAVLGAQDVADLLAWLRTLR